jgi:hypothetical protein
MTPERMYRPSRLNPEQTMPVSFFTDDEMRHFARARARIELDDGRTATLTRWATPERPYLARMVFYNGNFFTTKKIRVVKVELPSETKEQTNE